MKKNIIKKWNKKHLLGIENLCEEEIRIILRQAGVFKEVLSRPIPKVPALRGKTIANLFFEPSTRTKLSFEIACKSLSADTVSVSSSSSSVLKGETLKDTAKNIEAMNADAIIIRHSSAGAALLLSKAVNCSIINAGDGSHEHPTQALLDMMTIEEHKGNIKNLNISIIGDISHSRVARSNIFGLVKMGAKLTLCGPATLIPPEIEKLGVKVTYSIKDAVEQADVINVLRIQQERQKHGLFPSIREYRSLFCIDEKILKHAKPGLIIMHPGPVNRGIEMSSVVADLDKKGRKPYSVILQQVTNGIAVRMAVLYLLSAHGERENE